MVSEWLFESQNKKMNTKSVQCVEKKGTCLSEFEVKNRKWSQMAFEANIMADFSYDLEMHEKFISKTYNLKYSK